MGAGIDFDASDIDELLPYLSAEERDFLLRITASINRGQIWAPLPGPQWEALHSAADIVFFGGAAGGGKSDLLLGAAATMHRRSAIFRREYGEVRGLIDRSLELFSSWGAFNSSDKIWRLRYGGAIRTIEFGAVQFEEDKQKWQGRAHDLKGFDELPRFTESQFRFLCGWLRSANPKQRTRVIAAGNPPTDSDGEWVIRFFAPWLDDHHPRPAKPGELRWYTTIGGSDQEREDGTPFEHEGEIVYPLSRTFIPSRVQDNPYYMRSGYLAQLQALPEPLRSKMLLGDFRAGREDNAFQVIPTEWIRLAQERWKTRRKPDSPMTAAGVDPSRGGQAKFIVACRYDNWIDELKSAPGVAVPNGDTGADFVALHVRDSAQINVDSIGIGTSVYDSLIRNKVPNVQAINAGEVSYLRDKSGRFGFTNKRSELWWKAREALDPKDGADLALPPDPELLADLAAPRWTLTPRGIEVESKHPDKEGKSKGIIARLGRSPDKGDAVVMSLWFNAGDFAASTRKGELQ